MVPAESLSESHVSILRDQELGVSSVPGPEAHLLLEKETEGQSCTRCKSEPQILPHFYSEQRTSAMSSSLFSSTRQGNHSY